MTTSSSTAAPRYHLPPLYTTDKSGREREWKVWVVGDTAYRSSGLVDGKKVESKRQFSGKNIGKKNETTPQEQARQEAEREWTSKLDKNYKPKCDQGKNLYKKVMSTKAETGGHNINASASIRDLKKKVVKAPSTKSFVVAGSSSKAITPLIPMKAQVWDLEDSKNVNSVLPRVTKHFDFSKGVYVQWKLDGYRCVVRVVDGEVILTSNNNKQFPWFASLREEVKKFVNGMNYLDGLDCELYCHSMTTSDGKEMDDTKRFSTIQEICSISRKEPHPLEDQISLYVFDLVDLSGEHTQVQRFDLLNKLFSRSPGNSRIVFTKTQKINKVEQVSEWLNEFCHEGYEGIVIRDSDLRYKTKHRSLKMRKLKYFIDEEYRVVDAVVKEGVDVENFVWVCRGDQGKTFSAKPMGTHEEKRVWFANKADYIGRRLTVKFQEFTSDGVPRFPIAKGFRDEGDI